MRQDLNNFKGFKLWHGNMNVYLNRDHVVAIRGPLGHRPPAMEIEMAAGSIHVVAATEEDVQGWLAQ